MTGTVLTKHNWQKKTAEGFGGFGELWEPLTGHTQISRPPDARENQKWLK